MQSAQFYPADFLVKTQGLTVNQKAILMVFWCIQMCNEKALPNDEKELTKILLNNGVKLRNAKPQFMAVLNQFFVLKPDGWWHVDYSKDIDQKTVKPAQKKKSKKPTEKMLIVEGKTRPEELDRRRKLCAPFSSSVPLAWIDSEAEWRITKKVIQWKKALNDELREDERNWISGEKDFTDVNDELLDFP